MNFFRYISVVFAIFSFLFLPEFLIAGIDPSASWRTPDNSNTQSVFIDCFGPSSQTDAIQETGTIPSGSPLTECQNYNTDGYESLGITDQGLFDSDIVAYRTGFEDNPGTTDDFFLFEIEFYDDFNCSGLLPNGADACSNTGHKYYITINIDSDDRMDYFCQYSPSLTHITASWNAVGTPGAFECFFDDDKV